MDLWFSLMDGDAPLGMDALVHDWPRALMYAFPLKALIPAVLERVESGGFELIQIAPRCPDREWFPELIALLPCKPWRLPVRQDLLSQARREIWHPTPERWLLAAWPLKGRGCRSQS